MKTIHLYAGLLACPVIVLILAAGSVYAERLEAETVRALPFQIFTQKSVGVALQRQAIDQPDMLLLLGSSELRGDNSVAPKFFAAAPTGFVVFGAGLHAANTLVYAQQLASLGSELRGKKVVLSLSPGFFLLPMLEKDAYAFNFSRLHSYDLAFSTDLSWETKRIAARRMLQYPATLNKDQFLRNALNALNRNELVDQAQYWLMFPLGRLQTVILRLQDHWATVSYIRSQKNLAAPAPKPQAINWKLAADAATQEYVAVAKTNEFGIADAYWKTSGAEWLKLEDTLSDEDFVSELSKSAEWTDLDLMLRILKELGAEPLVLSQPIKGTFYNYMGVSAQARAAYYDRLEQSVGSYGYPVQDFRKYDEDLWFSSDWLGHMSAKGWVYFNKAIDDFYHARLK